MQKRKPKKLNCNIWIIGIIVALLYAQHYAVPMFFDDYGYASLSYGWNGNQHGMLYTIGDVFNFLKFQYLNWGGRIVYFFFEIMVFRIGGVRLIQVLQTLIITGIILLTAQIIMKNIGERNILQLPVIYILSFAMYGTFALFCAADGIYWYTSSVLYVWPFLPFLLGILINMQNQVKRRWINLAYMFLMFLAAFSQEQVAVLIIVYSVLDFSFELLLKKEKLEIALHGMIGACVGGGLEILAPGNFNRASNAMYSEFSNYNIIQKIKYNFPKLLEINIGDYNWIFIIILSVVLVEVCLQFEKKVFHRMVPVILALILGIIYGRFNTIPEKITLCIKIVWCILFTTILILYFIKNSSWKMLALLIGGLCSQGMMLVIPSISVRSCLPFMFVLHIVSLNAMIEFGKIEKYKKLSILIMMCIGLYGIVNFSYILHGYWVNYETQQMNHYKLLEASYQKLETKEKSEIVLYKLLDDKFANIMQYREGYDYMIYWICKYYEIPENINFIWRDSLYWCEKNTK